MDRSVALSKLPDPYAAAIRLRELGLDREIAAQLGIPEEAVPPLLEIADAKLALLLMVDGSDTS